MPLEIWVIKNIVTNEFQSKRHSEKDNSKCPRIFYSEGTAKAFITLHTNVDNWFSDYWKENSFKPVKLLCRETNE